MKERRFQIDDAPGKALLESIRDTADLEAFADFYRQRRDWWRYPLIHDRLVTYGIFHDLTNNLATEAQALLLPKAVSLAEVETDKLFLCTVFLILDLLDGFPTVDNQDDIRSRLRSLHPRARKLSLFPNMSCFWNEIANKVFPTDKDGSMLISDKDWREFTSLDLPPVDDRGWQNCPGGEDAVKKEIEEVRGGDFVLEYQRSALHQGAKYWIWLYRNVSNNPIWHWYVYVVTMPDGSTTLHRHSMHSVVNLSPEELVAQHAFGVRD